MRNSLIFTGEYDVIKRWSMAYLNPHENLIWLSKENFIFVKFIETYEESCTYLIFVQKT